MDNRCRDNIFVFSLQQKKYQKLFGFIYESASVNSFFVKCEGDLWGFLCSLNTRNKSFVASGALIAGRVTCSHAEFR